MLEHSETLCLIEKSQAGDNAAKERLIEHNSPLIKSIIRRYRNKGVEYDDLYQLGCIGLLKAINHFDKTYGVQFSTYAVPMIAGEVKRFLRDDGAIKVSRQFKVLSGKINAYIDAHKKEHGESPTLEEISREFGIEQQELIFILDSNKMPVSIYDKSDDQDEHSQSFLDKLGEDKTDEVIDRIIMKDLIEALPDKERQIIILRFFRDKTQSEIARVIGVSQVQVSRMESKILQKIKESFRVTI